MRGRHAELKRKPSNILIATSALRRRTNQDLFETYIGPKAGDERSPMTSDQLHAVMGAAKNFLATAIADNRTQMKAISDVADRTEAGVSIPRR